jgi:hypothetical protein
MWRGKFQERDLQIIQLNELGEDPTSHALTPEAVVAHFVRVDSRARENVFLICSLLAYPHGYATQFSCDRPRRFNTDNTQTHHQW